MPRPRRRVERSALNSCGNNKGTMLGLGSTPAHPTRSARPRAHTQPKEQESAEGKRSVSNNKIFASSFQGDQRRNENSRRLQHTLRYTRKDVIISSGLGHRPSLAARARRL